MRRNQCTSLAGTERRLLDEPFSIHVRCCLMGALIGAPIGAPTAGVVGALYLF